MSKQPTTSPPQARSATTTSVVVSQAFPSASPAPTINQPVIERTQTVIQSGLTEALLDARLLALTNDVNSRLSQVAGARAYQAERTAENVADALRIEQFTGLTAHDLTVDGVVGLTDADLPDSLTASNYLPLSGGSITGDLSIGGTLSASTLSVAGIASGGAIEAPYFTATSSIATSTFAGAVAIGTTTPWGLLSIKGAGASTGKAFVMSDVNDVTRFVIQDNGNVGIGTTNPLYKLQVRTGTNQNFQVRPFSFGSAGLLLSASNDADTTPVPLEFAASQFTFNTGNVGIGVATPRYPLHVKVNTNANFKVRNLNGVTTLQAANDADSSSTGLDLLGSTLRIRDDSLGTFGGISVGAAGDRDLRIGQDSTHSIILGWKYNATAGSGRAILETWGGNNPLTLQGSGGNVGIGTTSPGTKLEVSGIDRILQLTRSSGTPFPWSLNVSGTGKFSIWDQTNSADRLVLDQSGNVGIGTASPGARFVVQSSTQATAGDLTADTTNGTAAVTVGRLSGTAGDHTKFVTRDRFGVEYLVVDPAGAKSYFNTGNVGISTTTPQNLLDVGNSGSAGAHDIAVYPSGNSGSTAGIKSITQQGVAANSYIKQDSFGAYSSGSGSTGHGLNFASGRSGFGSFFFRNSSDNVGVAIVDPAAGAEVTSLPFAANLLVGGNVGIGTTNPTYKLDVSGLGRFTGLVDAANFVATSSSVASLFNGGFLSLASTTIGNGAQAGGLTISGGATTTGNAYFAGNVGIGTQSPAVKLSVSGGNISIDAGSSLLLSTPTDSNWRIGKGTSAFTKKVHVEHH
jgi:hypothetical protein